MSTHNTLELELPIHIFQRTQVEDIHDRLTEAILMNTHPHHVLWRNMENYP